jgi:FkbM family methyltransferase
MDHRLLTHALEWAISVEIMNDSIFAARRAANAEHGDQLFGEPTTQKTLRYQKHGSTVFDGADEVNLAYYFPSAVGSSLFYYGHFEAGEIAFIARLLESVPEPIILDVGANVGTHSLAWARALETATVFAFEPAPGNIELLSRNIDVNQLSKRVSVVPSAVGDAVGKAAFFEADDSAYSALRDTRRRPLAATYDVDVTTIDAFVQNAGLKSVSLIKIDVEGGEDGVIAGATETLAAFQPVLFVEIFGGASSNMHPEQTIAAIVEHGYRAYIVSDGLITPYEKHDDAFYNYLFVPEASTRQLPAPDLRLKRSLDAERLQLIDKLTNDLDRAHQDVLKAQHEWEALDRVVQEKDASIQEKDASLQEKDASLQEKDASLQEKDASLQEKDAELQAKDAAIQEKDTALQQNDAALHKNDIAMREKEAALQAKDQRIVELTEAARALDVQIGAKEALIANLGHSASTLTAQLTQAAAEVEAKDKILLRLDVDMREKDALIARLSSELGQYSEQIAHLHAQLQKKQETIDPIQAEMEMLRSAALERLAVISELARVAEERLALIDNLTAQLQPSAQPTT